MTFPIVLDHSDDLDASSAWLYLGTLLDEGDPSVAAPPSVRTWPGETELREESRLKIASLEREPPPMGTRQLLA